MRDFVSLPRWIALLTGLAFYTAIGLLFTVPSPAVRFLSLVLVYLAWQRPRISIGLVLTAGVVTGLIFSRPEDSWGQVVSRAMGWGCVTGTILVGSMIFSRIFHGADGAAVALPFGRTRGTNIAYFAFFLYRLIPELETRLRRIAFASRVYGNRQLRPTWYSSITLITNGFITYFLESIDVLLGFERVAMRRRSIFYDAARSRRTMRLSSFIGSWAFILVVLVALRFR